MKQKILSKINQWFKTRNQAGNPQVFNSKNIYIIPSSFGWLYALVLLTLFTGAINYQISLIFLLVFLLALVGIGSAWEAHANFKGLGIKLLNIDDTEEGCLAYVNLLIQSNNKVRYALEFQCQQQDSVTLEKIPLEELSFKLPLETSKRGCFKLPVIKVASHYPLGLFTVWGYAYFDNEYYVYPQATFAGFWPNYVNRPHTNQMAAVGDNEVYDLRQVENPWTQPNLIAWKIAAKEQGWYVKTMDSTFNHYWQFQLQDLPGSNLEERMRNLSYWLQEAEIRGDFYSLKLGKLATDFSHGPRHLHYCLRQLATYS
ncbi:hypothetical protein ACNVED_08515 [Legionella sp. D16C41]|uniref:hypothetical protein n=1 Tax=Legionella sp. D16C41 TaxID=3402688 RepID=UPI003AF78DA3